MGASTWFEGASFAGELIQHYEKENRQQVKEWGLASRLSTRWDIEFGKAAGGKEEEIDVEDEGQCEGDIRLRKIEWLLDNALDIAYGWDRTESQSQFCRAYLIAALPKIYGKDWERHSARVMARFNVRQVKQLVLGMTPRRWGKTIVVALFCAVLLLCVPGLHISTFSTGKRASGLLMGEVRRLMSGIPGANERIVRSNAESFNVATGRLQDGVSQHSETAKRMANDVSSSIFHSYPSSVDGQNICTPTHTHTRVQDGWMDGWMERRRPQAHITQAYQVSTHIHITHTCRMDPYASSRDWVGELYAAVKGFIGSPEMASLYRLECSYRKAMPANPKLLEGVESCAELRFAFHRLERGLSDLTSLMASFPKKADRVRLHLLDAARGYAVCYHDYRALVIDICNHQAVYVEGAIQANDTELLRRLLATPWRRDWHITSLGSRRGVLRQLNDLPVEKQRRFAMGPMPTAS